MRAATCSSAPPCSKGFEAFWATSACAASATSYPYCSAAPLPWPSGFLGLRPCPSQGAPFWPSGLTLRSSGRLRRRLPWFVSTEENQFISPMLLQTAFNFSSVVQRLVCRFSGLRLVALRWFVVFLASGPCVASASSYFFRSAAQPRWRCAFSQFAPVAKSWLPVLASGSNLPVKPTRLRRSAYLAR